MTDDLTVWLRAQLDEDERIAQAVRDPQWTSERMVDSVALQTDHVLHIGDRVFGADGGEGELRPSEAEHIAYHDPARVLAEVAAKRAILDAYEVALEVRDEDPHDETRTADASTLGFVVERFAQPYADRPGWREEWRA